MARAWLQRTGEGEVGASVAAAGSAAACAGDGVQLRSKPSSCTLPGACSSAAVQIVRAWLGLAWRRSCSWAVEGCIVSTLGCGAAAEEWTVRDGRC